MKLNRKGYMLVEIILASVIAFGVAYFILNLTLRLKNKNDDLLVETQVVTDKTIITNKLMEYARIEGKEFDCDEKLNITGKTISYDGNQIDILNDYVNFGEVYSCENNLENNEINIHIPLEIPQLSDEDFDIRINYKYLPPLVYTVTYDWNVNLFALDNTGSGGLTYSYAADTLKLNGTWSAMPSGTTNSFSYHHITLGTTAELDFTEGNKYKLNMTRQSGNYSITDGNVDMAVQPNDGTSDIQGHTKNIIFPTSGENSDIFTSGTDTASAKKFVLWLHKQDASAVTFDNYNVGVRLTRVEEIANTYGERYVVPENNPTRSGYIFDGWYTSPSGGTLVDEDTIMNRNENHTLYAHYTSVDTTKPTCKLQASGSTVSFKTKTDNVGVTAYQLIKGTTTPTYNNTNSLSISTGTFYGYVKDAAGNTGKCSITIIATTKKSTYTCRHALDKCSNYTLASGACYHYQNQISYAYNLGPYNSKSACLAGCSGGTCTTSAATQLWMCHPPSSPCPSGYSVYGSRCRKYMSALNACSSGTKSGSYCYKYNQTSCASDWTKSATNTTYSCASGYTKINNSYCYKY